MTKRPIFAFLLLTAGCAASPESPATMADFPALNMDRVLTDIRRLSSDEFEGRAPGSPGDTLTVAYLTEQLTAAGLEPGNPDGTWTQQVSLVGLTPKPQGPLVVKKGAQAREFTLNDEVVAFSKHVADEARIENSELVFVGYGVQAPEYQWDDFRGIDVKGKTLVVLVNDPPVAGATPGSLDEKTFGGNAMTYYGRWTYKYEKAAELGAAGVFVVHETVPAGYPFSVVQGLGLERFDLVTPDKNMGRSAIEGWLTVEAATALLKMGGQDYQTLKAQAATRDFKPVALGLTASMAISQQMRTVSSENVIAKLTGSDPQLKNEYVIYTAHWDHLGVTEPVNGDRINNGALDNASGTSLVLEIARAIKSIAPPKRSTLFLFVTAEEQGLLGSQYYAEFPLYPLEKTVAAINIDGFNQWGRTRDMVVVGLGASDLDDYARAAATEQGRVLTPDAEPEKGFYYRSDHFNFAKKGVPAFYADSGIEFIGKPDGYGKQKREEYTNNDYHAPSDEVKPDWDLAGAAEDGLLFMIMGYRIADADRMPEWKPGNEFKSIRDRALGR
jgi:Zn-dependent M28 family amino/carboxypeptidase